jgi:putative FmdB family regulatory protein
MPLHDFKCPCGHIQEEIVSADSKPPKCEDCGKKMHKVFLKSPTTITSFIPTYPGCKKQKAGYTHTSHADQAATKLQSGYGGCQAPK